MKRHSKIKREKIGTYIIFSNESGTRHIIAFKNVMGERKFVRVNSEISEEYQRQKREENSYNIKFCRYIEHSELSDYKLNERAIYKIPSAEDVLIEEEGKLKIIEKIWNLPSPQNRRVYMKLVEGYSLTKIAKIEKRAIPVIKRSVDRGIKNLRKNLENF